MFGRGNGGRFGGGGSGFGLGLGGLGGFVGEFGGSGDGSGCGGGAAGELGSFGEGGAGGCEFDCEGGLLLLEGGDVLVFVAEAFLPEVDELGGAAGFGEGLLAEGVDFLAERGLGVAEGGVPGVHAVEQDAGGEEGGGEGAGDEALLEGLVDDDRRRWGLDGALSDIGEDSEFKSGERVLVIHESASMDWESVKLVIRRMGSRSGERR